MSELKHETQLLIAHYSLLITHHYFSLHTPLRQLITHNSYFITVQFYLAGAKIAGVS